MKRFKALILAIFVAISVTAQVAVESKIDSVAILIGQQAHLIVGVTAPKGKSIVFPQYKPYQHITPGVEVIETSNADTSNLDNGLVKVSKIFTITSFDEHLYAIPGMKVKVNGKICQGNPLALKVLTVDVDTLHPNQFYPPKDVQDNPFLWKEWSSIFWLSILMLLFCAIGYYLFIRLHDNKPIITHIRVVKKVLPHQKALNVINKLKEDHIVNSDNPKEYYTKLTDALRLYIEERFGFNAMEMTSSEIIEKMKSTGDQKMIDELHELFQTADLVKFAKYSTLINENDLNLVNAINFIDQTKLEGQPTVEKIVPKLSEEDKRTRKARITIKAFIYVIIITIALALTYIVYNVSQLLL